MVMVMVLTEVSIHSEICSSNSLTELSKTLDHHLTHLTKTAALKKRKREERKRELKDLSSSLKML